jgi:hypothetical protein
LNGIRGDFAGVSTALRDVHVGGIATRCGEQRRGLRRARTGNVDASTGARNGIDDDGYRGSRRSTFGGRNQTSSPGRRDVRP